MEFGMMTALITPLNEDGTINESEFRRIIENQIDSGVHSLLVLGGTGEIMTLNPEYRKKAIEIAVKATKKRVPIVAGVVELRVEEAINASKVCKDAGADAIMVSTPFGAKTSTQGCINFYKSISDAVDMPILIYNFQGRTGYNTTPEIVEQLINNVPNIIGIKECTEKFDQTVELVARVGDRIQVLSGIDALAPWDLLMGTQGAITAVSNVIPKQCVTMYEYAKEGKADAVIEIGMKYQSFLKLLFKEPHPGPLKFVMKQQGFDVGDPILPALPISKELQEELIEMMNKLKLL